MHPTELGAARSQQAALAYASLPDPLRYALKGAQMIAALGRGERENDHVDLPAVEALELDSVG